MAQDFGRLGGSGPAHPDFSTAGDLITFGFFTGNGTAQPFDVFTESGLDNYALTAESMPANVPEPTSLLLLGTGLTAVRRLANRKRDASPAGRARTDVVPSGPVPYGTVANRAGRYGRIRHTA